MSALDALARIASRGTLLSCDFRWCLVSDTKIPYKPDGSKARPNAPEDFCSLEELSLCDSLEDYAGVGISVNASGVCAIDIDKCFSEPFEEGSGDKRAKAAIEAFKDLAYVEFSFSGRGLRILFFADPIPDYSSKYYVKCDKTKTEFYQPSGSARYVTVTGMAICDNPVAKMSDTSALTAFLDEYMLRPKALSRDMPTRETEEGEALPLEELLKKAKSLYLRDLEFQDAWFAQAPGSGSNESQMDFHLCSLIWRKITGDKDSVREVFEASPYYKSKDWKHVRKWEYNGNRYFNYIWDHLGV